jgi:AbiV family abortive infection protein
LKGRCETTIQRNARQLSAEDLREAGIKSLQNASELVEEAQLLFEHGRWSRAVFLCCISGEELGKCFMSLSAVVNRKAGRFDENRYIRRFRTHQEKTGLLHFFEDIFVSSSDVPAQVLDIDAQTLLTEKVKLAALYCDFYGVQPCAPSELITEQLASGALKLAKNRVKHFTEQIRPMFDRALQIDPAEIMPFLREFLRSMRVDVESDADS